MACGTTAGFTMEFKQEGAVIFASGKIYPGDKERFAGFVHANNIVSDSMQSYSVRLSSPGGNLLEGMALGRAIRKAKCQR
jgi:hypothetical protein